MRRRGSPAGQCAEPHRRSPGLGYRDNLFLLLKASAAVKCTVTGIRDDAPNSSPSPALEYLNKKIAHRQKKLPFLFTSAHALVSGRSNDRSAAARWPSEDFATAPQERQDGSATSRSGDPGRRVRLPFAEEFHATAHALRPEQRRRYAASRVGVACVSMKRHLYNRPIH